jgi:short-subunit dehydrogenase
VTGSSAGIGADLARELAARGHNVTLVARRRERLEELAAELEKAHGVTVEVEPCDLGDRTSREQLLQRLQGEGRRTIAGLCNNAGLGSFGLFWELDPGREQEQVEVNVDALHHFCAVLLPGMVERGAGAILNVGSLAGNQPQPSNSTYAATKAFVNSFSEGVHTELHGTGVSCTVVCPGPVKTEFAEAAGMSEFADAGPGFLWASSAEVARVAVDGMDKGKRVVVPRAAERAMGLMGRYAPRTVMLPVMQRMTQRGLKSRGK